MIKNILKRCFFNSVVFQSSFWLRKPFLYFLCRRYAGTHESTIFIMRTHRDAINDLMIDKCLHKRLYEHCPQRPVRFVDFLANPSDQKYFFKESSLHVYYLPLVISLFLKVYIFLQVLQICHFASCILWYFDFIQVATRNYLSLGEQIATQMEQCLKMFGVKFKLLYIGSNHYFCA